MDSVETKTTYRIAPPGFTPEQWATFLEDGIIVIENALTEDEVAGYLEAIDRVTGKHPKYVPGEYFSLQNFVEQDPVLAGVDRSSAPCRVCL